MNTSSLQPTLLTVQTQTDFSHCYRVKACIIWGLPTMPDPKPSPSPSHNAPTPPQSFHKTLAERRFNTGKLICFRILRNNDPMTCQLYFYHTALASVKKINAFK